MIVLRGIGMASILKSFAQLGHQIEMRYAGKVREIEKLFIDTNKEMLQEFRNRQYASPQIKPGKRTRNTRAGKKGTALRQKPTSEDMANAKAFAKAKQNQPPLDQPITPWTNRTFWAARGVHGYVHKEADSIRMGLYHSMPYGAYLEYGKGRRFAVLVPLVRQYVPKIMEEVKRIMGAK